MVETPFALSKYLNMIRTMIAEDNAQDIEFAFNVETLTACENIRAMLSLSDVRLLTGITVGRVDLSGSMEISRELINISNKIFTLAEFVLQEAKEYKLKTGLGGGISKEALPVIERLALLLDKFETRKVVFPIASYKYGEQAIIEANRFELLWLQSKRRYYSRIKVEDEKRIQMLEERIK